MAGTSSLSEPQELAAQAGLRYVSDSMPGIRRQRRGRGFTYIDPQGKRITDVAELQRIHELVIPPAWEDVWVCPLRTGHIQVTGRDARGRKQYRYHERWSEISNQTKFDRMLEFGEQLPKIREQVRKDLAVPVLNKRKVVAAVIEILDRTMIRVGNREYAEANESFGATTLTHDHVEVQGSTVRFEFKGKSGKQVEVDLRDRRLARVVQRCEEIPGHELFQYLNGDGSFHPVESADINEYLRDVSGKHFTAKDFRTFHGTVVALKFLCECEGGCESRGKAEKLAKEAIKTSAAALANTVTVCRKYYVHPEVLELFVSGGLADHIRTFRRSRCAGLCPEEQLLLYTLRKLQRPKRKRSSRKLG